MVFDDQGKIERIVRVERNDAHRLIEECMLAANVCASDFLQGHEHPTLYRVHEGPTPEKLERPARVPRASSACSSAAATNRTPRTTRKLLARSRAGPTCSCCRP